MASRATDPQSKGKRRRESSSPHERQDETSDVEAETSIHDDEDTATYDDDAPAPATSSQRESDDEEEENDGNYERVEAPELDAAARARLMAQLRKDREDLRDALDERAEFARLLGGDPDGPSTHPGAYYPEERAYLGLAPDAAAEAATGNGSVQSVCAREAREWHAGLQDAGGAVSLADRLARLDPHSPSFEGWARGAGGGAGPSTPAAAARAPPAARARRRGATRRGTTRGRGAPAGVGRRPVKRRRTDLPLSAYAPSPLARVQTIIQESSATPRASNREESEESEQPSSNSDSDSDSESDSESEEVEEEIGATVDDRDADPDYEESAAARRKSTKRQPRKPRAPKAAAPKVEQQPIVISSSDDDEEDDEDERRPRKPRAPRPATPEGEHKQFMLGSSDSENSDDYYRRTGKVRPRKIIGRAFGEDIYPLNSSDEEVIKNMEKERLRWRRERENK